MRNDLANIAASMVLVLAAISVSAVSKPLSEEECGAVYNDKTWSCRVDGNNMVQRFHASLTILNKKGEDYNSISLVETDFIKIKNLKARILDAAGNTVFERDKKDFSKACGYDNISLYADICHLYTTLSVAQYPYTIEWEYTRESKSLFFWYDARFQEEVPVHHAEYVLDVPADFSFRYRAYEIELEPSVTKSENGRVIYTWEIDDLPPLDDVDYVPPDENQPARICFAAEFSLGDYRVEECSWQGIGQWYIRMAEDRYCPDRLIPGLFTTSDGPHGILQFVYNYVTERIRYVAIQIGIGGWQPYHAEKTNQRGFGDCKDMSTLLVSELRNRGIECYPALILTRDEGVTDPDFPTVEFNHVISVTIVAGDTVWMDATCDVCRYNELPTGVQNRPALVMTGRGGQLWHTPATTAEDNLITRRTSWSINSDLSAGFTTVLSTTGGYARYLRSAIPGLDNDEIRQLVNRQFRGADKKFKIESYTIANLDSLHLPVEISIDATSLKPLRTIGSTAYFDPFVLNELSSREMTDLSDRPFSLDLYYPDLEHDIISVTWDPALALDSLVIPESDSLSFTCGSFSLECFKGDSTVTIDIRKTYNTYLIEPAQFADFDQYRQRVKKTLSQHIKFYQM